MIKIASRALLLVNVDTCSLTGIIFLFYSIVIMLFYIYIIKLTELISVSSSLPSRHIATIPVPKIFSRGRKN